VLAWWVVSVCVWMLSLSAYSGADMMAAVLAGLPCALTAVAARRAVRGHWRPGWELLAALAALPGSVARDSVVVLLLPWTRRRVGAGGLREIDLHAVGESSAANGRRAVGLILLSASPGSYVVEADPDRGTAVIHAVSGGSRLERVLTR
jgi:multisubunit Na+/H+ antiporter MnhE subunit